MRATWLLIPLMLAAARSPSQEVGVFAAQAWSDNMEMRNPRGFGAYA